MATITKRLTKGSELTYAEVDANFSVIETLTFYKDVGSSYSAAVNEMLMPDNSVSTATVTLPSGPSDGDFIIVKQKDGQPVSTHSIIIGRNGNNIDGAGANYTLSLDDRVWLFVFESTGSNWEVSVLGEHPSVIEESRFVSVSPPVMVYNASTANDDFDIDLTAYMPNGGEAVFSFWFDYEYNGFAESWAGIVASDEIPVTWTKSLYSEMSAQYVDAGSATHQTMGNLFKVSSTGEFRLHKEGSALNLYVRLISYRAW